MTSSTKRIVRAAAALLLLLSLLVSSAVAQQGAAHRPSRKARMLSMTRRMMQQRGSGNGQGEETEGVTARRMHRVLVEEDKEEDLLDKEEGEEEWDEEDEEEWDWDDEELLDEEEEWDEEEGLVAVGAGVDDADAAATEEALEELMKEQGVIVIPADATDEEVRCCRCQSVRSCV